MFNAVMTALLTVILLTLAVLGARMLEYSQSRKRNSLLLFMVPVLVYLLGHLLTFTSASADEAFAGAKLAYLGGLFAVSCALLFVADYCEIKVNLPTKILVYVIPLGMTVLFWTTRQHHLVYRSYSFDGSGAHFLHFEPGAGYFAGHAFVSLAFVVGIALAARQLVSGSTKYRSQIMMFFCTIPPFLATILDSIQEAFVLVDTDMRYLMSNSAARKIFGGLETVRKGAPIAEVVGWPEALVAPPDAATATPPVDFSLAGVGGAARHYRASLNRVSSNIGWIILIQDVTDNFILMKQLEEAAHTDPLTGLFNRRFFMIIANQYYEEALRSKHPYCILIVDLDFFKNINDSYGHLAGDEMLRETARRIKSNIRPYDLLARYGGEEFIILIPSTDVQESYKLAERIRQSVENMICLYESRGELTITCSIGLYAHTEGDTLNDMLKKADAAMYVAKEKGRNRVEIYSDSDYERMYR